MKQISRPGPVIHLAIAVACCVGLVAGVFADSNARSDLDAEYQAFKVEFSSEHYRQAAEHGERALAIGKSFLPADSEEIAILLMNYGAALNRIAELDKARDALSESLDRYVALYGDESEKLIPALLELGRTLAAGEPLYKARRHFKHALKIGSAVYGGDSGDYGILLIDVGTAILNNADSNEARRYLKKGHDILSRAFGPDDPVTGFAAYQLGRLELSAGKFARARKHFKKALASFEEPDRPSNQLELATHAFLVQVYENTQQRDLATQHCLAIGRMTPASDDQKAMPIFRTPAEYPIGSLMRGETGRVHLRFTIDEAGFVIDPEIVDLEGSDLFGLNAIKAVKEWRYAPSFKDGEPTARVFEQLITFTTEK